MNRNYRGKLHQQNTRYRTENLRSGLYNRQNGYIKENAKSKKLQTQNNQEIWDTVKRFYLRKIEIEEGEESQLKGPENIFNRIREEKFPNPKNEMPIKVQVCRTSNTLDQKRKSHQII